MSYALPFRPEDRVLEVGGGNNPAHPGHWVNMDIHPGPMVDIVADASEPWPVESESYDGVYCQFLLEHISWRKAAEFVKECHRVLMPGGIAILMTPNLLEQCKLAIEWFDQGKTWEVSQMLFGDQDYPENSHKFGLSPEYAIRLFREAGFNSINIYEHPIAKAITGRSTDMIIEARKNNSQITRSL